jgi:hypothetical protein
MNQTDFALSNIWHHFQTSLFPELQEAVGKLTAKQKQFIEVIELAQIETHLPYIGRVPGRPTADRSAIARAFVVKAVYNLPTTEILLDYLDATLNCAGFVDGKGSVLFLVLRPFQEPSLNLRKISWHNGFMRS